MPNRLIVVHTDSGHIDTIMAMAETAKVLDCQVFPAEGESRQTVHMLVSMSNRQAILDKLQTVLGDSQNWRITILPVEATIPLPSDEEEEEKRKSKGAGGQSREELYADVSANARMDRNFLLFVMLSTVVAAIGLIENNVAVVIGAMVIAPLLGPNLAFSLGVALGDRQLMSKALITNGAGVALTLATCSLIGLVWPLDFQSAELMSRTDVGYDGMALALASGAAATLSLSTGLSSALVGVMVAVALMPPAATMGLMIGSGQWNLAFGAALLLAVNVVCVNLAAQLTFVLRGVTPRTWFEKEAARRGVRINGMIWVFLLLALALLLYFRTPEI